MVKKKIKIKIKIKIKKKIKIKINCFVQKWLSLLTFFLDFLRFLANLLSVQVSKLHGLQKRSSICTFQQTFYSWDWGFHVCNLEVLIKGVPNTNPAGQFPAPNPRGQNSTPSRDIRVLWTVEGVCERWYGRFCDLYGSVTEISLVVLP